MLDRHYVECGNNPLLQFHLANDGSKDKWRFEYQCGSNEVESITSYYTAWNSDGGGKAIYLDRHQLTCSPIETHLAYVMTFFHLESSNGQIRFQFKCGYMKTANQLSNGMSIANTGSYLFSTNGQYRAEIIPYANTEWK